jgi:hypothetical protein
MTLNEFMYRETSELEVIRMMMRCEMTRKMLAGVIR